MRLLIVVILNVKETEFQTLKDTFALRGGDFTQCSLVP
jgi:hypothetical protein